MSSSELFIEHLLSVAPELMGVYNEHMIDNDVILPHVFMGDVVRFVILRSSNIEYIKIIRRIFDYLENEIRLGDSECLELIRASFVENLFGEKKVVDKIKPLMGPGLRREIDTIYGA